MKVNPNEIWGPSQNEPLPIKTINSAQRGLHPSYGRRVTVRLSEYREGKFTEEGVEQGYVMDVGPSFLIELDSGEIVHVQPSRVTFNEPPEPGVYTRGETK